MISKSAWITWETQRRSLELAKALGCDLYVFEYGGYFRYPKCIYDTTRVFMDKKYEIVFVQNPSMVLAAFACFYKYIFNKPTIVDRHSTFKVKQKKYIDLKHIVHNMLNSITIKLANITIVTNQYLADLVTQLGGKPYVLPDKIPDFPKPTSLKMLQGKYNILFICSYAKDEPIEEVLDAMNGIKDFGVTLYVTGNHSKLDKKILNKSPDNVVFTGFLSEKEYNQMLHSVEAVLVLTKSDFTMLCGCYEAVSAGRPIITSNKKVLVDYFKGSVFVKNDSKEIRNGILEMIKNHKQYSDQCLELKNQIAFKWKSNFENFVEEISKLQNENISEYKESHKIKE